MDDETPRQNENSPAHEGQGSLRRPLLCPSELWAHKGFSGVDHVERSKYVARISRHVRVNGKKKQRPEYAALMGAVQRCTNPNNAAWDRYGGRGIRVCERWMGPDGWDNFWQDMGPRPDGHSIDRIDNDGDYSPENCRWATTETQNRNTRANLDITINGETMCLVAWCERYGVPRRRVANRIDLGWDPLVALTAAPRSHKGRAHEKAGRPTADGMEHAGVGRGRSPFRGVHPSGRKWGAVIGTGGKLKWLGTYPTEEAAARAYDEAARELHGEAAALNFPEVA